MKKNKKTTIFY